MSYGERLAYLDLHSLKGRRIRGDMIETFKIFNGITNIDQDMFFTMSTLEKTRNQGDKIFKKHFNTNMRKFSFSNRVTNMWNDLPNTLKSAPSTDSFKNQLDI